ncbi:MAG: RluA family pseudouridine synthase [Acidobacteria bacterium]|nr:RluA family pseudouridine synthase [Acidobacteriota bacterium]
MPADDGAESRAGTTISVASAGSASSAGSPDRWKSSATSAGQRLDVYLAKVYKTSRNQAAGWIHAGLVAVGDKFAKPGLKLQGGEWISCEPLAPSQEGRVEPEPGSLVVLFEDQEIVVLDKPAALAVHPGAGRTSGTLANRLLAAYPEMAQVGGPGRPGIVHRLDLGTSGVLVAARTRRAHQALAEAFAQRAVKKTYLAIVFGAPADAVGTMTAPIARNPQRRKEMTVLLTGRPAETGYRVLATAANISFLELTPVTGRTHQIRVHLKHIGHPIVGDPLYGEARWRDLEKVRRKPFEEFDRPALHAWRIEFRHPTTGRPCRFEAPIPDDIQNLWRQATAQDLPLSG